MFAIENSPSIISQSIGSLGKRNKCWNVKGKTSCSGSLEAVQVQLPIKSVKTTQSVLDQKLSNGIDVKTWKRMWPGVTNRRLRHCCMPVVMQLMCTHFPSLPCAASRQRSSRGEVGVGVNLLMRLEVSAREKTTRKGGQSRKNSARDGLTGEDGRIVRPRWPAGHLWTWGPRIYASSRLCPTIMNIVNRRWPEHCLSYDKSVMGPRCMAHTK